MLNRFLLRCPKWSASLLILVMMVWHWSGDWQPGVMGWWGTKRAAVAISPDAVNFVVLPASVHRTDVPLYATGWSLVAPPTPFRGGSVFPTSPEYFWGHGTIAYNEHQDVDWVANERAEMMAGKTSGVLGITTYHGTTPAEMDYFVLRVPIWMFAALTSVWVLWGIYRAWRSRHSLKRGHCIGCGYDIRATPARCPECGLAWPAGGGLGWRKRRRFGRLTRKAGRATLWVRRNVFWLCAVMLLATFACRPMEMVAPKVEVFDDEKTFMRSLKPVDLPSGDGGYLAIYDLSDFYAAARSDAERLKKMEEDDSFFEEALDEKARYSPTGRSNETRFCPPFMVAHLREEGQLALKKKIEQLRRAR